MYEFTQQWSTANLAGETTNEAIRYDQRIRLSLMLAGLATTTMIRPPS
jgi:hypothetical protein